MGTRLIRPARNLLFPLLPIMLAIACASCIPGPAMVSPQPGGWSAEFSTETANGKEKHWILEFEVSEDGKTAPTMRLMHYIGELTADTNATVLFTANNPPIDNNSFEITFSEFTGYTSYTYKGYATFISSNEAEGLMTVDGVDCRWTAAPVSK